MAATTYTASQAVASVPVRYYETGVHANSVTYVGSGQSVSDIVRLMKLPQGAKVVDWYANATSAEATLQVKLGLTGAGETALGTITATASTATAFNARNLPGWVPAKVSLSDDVTPYNGYVYATLSAGSFTTTYTLNLTVFWSNEVA